MLFRSPGPTWQVVGTGDFYGRGLSDIVLENINGEVVIWEMMGNTIVGGGAVSTTSGPDIPGPTWQVLGTGDFTGLRLAAKSLGPAPPLPYGLADIVLQNINGEVVIWEMSGTSVIGGGAVQTGGSVENPGPTWRVVGTGDFYGRGRSDILLQNDSNSQPLIWEMDGTSVIGGGGIDANPGSGWLVYAPNELLN